jgi:hypothetical protein
MRTALSLLPARAKASTDTMRTSSASQRDSALSRPLTRSSTCANATAKELPLMVPSRLHDQQAPSTADSKVRREATTLHQTLCGQRKPIQHRYTLDPRTLTYLRALLAAASQAARHRHGRDRQSSDGRQPAANLSRRMSAPNASPAHSPSDDGQHASASCANLQTEASGRRGSRFGLDSALDGDDTDAYAHLPDLPDSGEDKFGRVVSSAWELPGMGTVRRVQFMDGSSAAVQCLSPSDSDAVRRAAETVSAHIRSVIAAWGGDHAGLGDSASLEILKIVGTHAQLGQCATDGVSGVAGTTTLAHGLGGVVAQRFAIHLQLRSTVNERATTVELLAEVDHHGNVVLKGGERLAQALELSLLLQNGQSCGFAPQSWMPFWEYEEKPRRPVHLIIEDLDEWRSTHGSNTDTDSQGQSVPRPAELSTTLTQPETLAGLLASHREQVAKTAQSDDAARASPAATTTEPCKETSPSTPGDVSAAAEPLLTPVVPVEPYELSAIRDQFQRMDIDQDGELSEEDCLAALGDCAYCADETDWQPYAVAAVRELRGAMARLAAHGKNEHGSWTGFVVVAALAAALGGSTRGAMRVHVRRLCSLLDSCEQVFRILDADSDGSIGQQDLSVFLASTLGLSTGLDPLVLQAVQQRLCGPHNTLGASFRGFVANAYFFARCLEIGSTRVLGFGDAGPAWIRDELRNAAQGRMDDQETVLGTRGRMRKSGW